MGSPLRGYIGNIGKYVWTCLIFSLLSFRKQLLKYGRICSFILTEYEPVASHGDPLRTKFCEVPFKGEHMEVIEIM